MSVMLSLPSRCDVSVRVSESPSAADAVVGVGDGVGVGGMVVLVAVDGCSLGPATFALPEPLPAHPLATAATSTSAAAARAMRRTMPTALPAAHAPVTQSFGLPCHPDGLQV